MLSGPGELFSLVFLRALTTSSVLKVSVESPGFSVVNVSASWVELSVSNLVKKELRSLGRDVELLPATWMVVQLVATVLTSAMVLRPCQAERRFP